MLDGLILNYIEDVNLCSKHLGESHRVRCRVGRSRGKVSSKENSLERQSLRRYGLNLRANGKRWPACRTQYLLRRRTNDSSLESAAAVRSQYDDRRLMLVGQL